MSDSTSKLVHFNTQPNDTRPLPEIIAEVEGFPLAYVDDLDGKRYYAVQDWIRGVAKSSEPRVLWGLMKRRLKKAGIELFSLGKQLAYTASDGKRYKMDHADAEGLYLVTQRMEANTGIRNQVLEFLARSGVTLDEMRIDPEQAIDAAIEAYRRMGKTEEWIAVRIQGKAIRLEFTAAFRKSLRQEPSRVQYALITDTMRLGVWKRRTAKLKEQMGLGENDNLRDHQSSMAIAFEALAESISAYELRQKQDLQFKQSETIVRKRSESVGRYAKKASNELGIDIATGKPLLPSETGAPE